MSLEAITWALTQPIKHSSAKFVLTVLANYADADMVCWPSTAKICEQTSQDRKTVQENMRRLRELGYLEDTGERKGATRQVVVYRLTTPKEAQKRNSSDNGTHPKFPSNRPEIPAKEAQISLVTGPKTGDGTINEPSIEPSGKQKRARKAATVILPDWLPLDAWEKFCRWRGVKFGDDAKELNLGKLATLRAEGHDPAKVLLQSVELGYKGVFPLRANQARGSPKEGVSQQTMDEAAKMLFGENHATS